MMELIFGMLLKMALGLVETLLNFFTAFLELDLQQIIDYFPFLVTGLKMFQIIAVGFVAMIAMTGLFRFFAGPMAEARESPNTILIRSAVAIFTIYYGGYLINWAVGLAKIPYEAFVSLDATDVSGVGKTVTTGILNFVKNCLTEAGGAAVGIPPYLNVALSLFLVVAIGWNMLKLIIEICERYLMVGVLAYTSPLLFSTIASEGSSSIFKRWVGMFTGQLIIMTLSVWSYDLVISGLSAMIADQTATSAFRLILVFAACRIGLRVDTYMQQLGIGVGTTGGSLLDEAVGISHTVGSFLRNRGGSQNEGKASNGVLGGHVDSKGHVRPDPVNSGLFGAARSGFRSGVVAFRGGGSADDVLTAAKDGASKGFGFGRQKDGTFDTSALMGRRMGNRISDLQRNRANSLSPVTSAEYGGVAMSADGTQSHLDQTAKDNGLKLDRDKKLQGDAGISGGFMASNMGKEAAHDILSNTARQGDPAASEKALFGTHNNLSYDATASEVDKAKFDQLGSDMLSATMSKGMNDLDQKAAASDKPLSPEEQSVRAVGAVMQTSMAEAAEGNRVGTHLADFQASDVGDKGTEGRQVSANVIDDKGQKIGSVSACDEKAFNGMSEEQRQGYIPMTSSSGATYYMKSDVQPQADVQDKAAGTAVAEGGTAVATGSGAAPAGEGDVRASSPVVAASERPVRAGSKETFFDTSDAASPAISGYGEEVGMLSIGRSGGKDVIKSDDGDALYTASAISEGLTHPNNAVEQLAKDTVHSPEMSQMVAESALFSEQTGGIPVGHDPEMATMMNKMFTGDDIGGAIGSVIPAGDASQISGAMSRAAEGIDDGSGYQVKNISTSEGVVSFEYSTPSGDSYQVQTMKAEKFESMDSPPASVDMVAGGTDDHYRVSVTQISGGQSAPAPSGGAPEASGGEAVHYESGPAPQTPGDRELGRAGRQMYDDGAHPDFQTGGSIDAKNTGKKKKRGRRR